MVIRAGYDCRRNEGAAASAEGESRVSSKARGGKGRTVVVVAAAGTTAAVAGEAILNSLITGDFRKNNSFRLRNYSGNFINNDNLIAGALNCYMLIPLALVAFSNEVNLQKKIWDFCFYYLFRRSYP